MTLSAYIKKGVSSSDGEIWKSTLKRGRRPAINAAFWRASLDNQKSRGMKPTSVLAEKKTLKRRRVRKVASRMPKNATA